MFSRGFLHQKMGDTGFEQTHFCSGNSEFLIKGGAKSGAHRSETANLTEIGDTDEALQDLIRIWSLITEDARQTLLDAAYAISVKYATTKSSAD